MKLLKILSLFLVPAFANFTEPDSYNLTAFVYQNPKHGCNGTICIRKCCRPNYHISNASCIFSNNTTEFSVTVFEEEQAVNNNMSTLTIVSGIMRCTRSKRYRLDPKIHKKDRFLIQKDGRLYQPVTKIYTDYDQFCVENFDDISFSAIICSRKWFPIGKRLNLIGMLISLPFLLATLIVFLLLPERNFPKKSLMCYVMALLFGYLNFVIVQLQSKSMSISTCAIFGSSCIFFFLATFFWMNAISLDIYWTFSGSRGYTQPEKDMENKRFRRYFAYAWGIPLLMVFSVISISYGVSPKKWFNSGLGNGYCWLKDKKTQFLYFYGPMGILTFINIVLFIRTYWRIRSVYRANEQFHNQEAGRNHFENQKQRFAVYLKLMMAMGINWSTEFISWTICWQVETAPEFLWYLTDLCNALYGVFIFFIFAFKTSIFLSLTTPKVICCRQDHKSKFRFFTYMNTGRRLLAHRMMNKINPPALTDTRL